MTFLPIVERELRVAARKRSTFWVRVLAALVAVFLGAGFLILSLFPLPGPIGMGRALFGTLTWLSLAAVLPAGLFLTSDCVSEEKRQGTLGFLFLTDLRGYDVVLGKMMATSLRGMLGLLAVVPVLAMTLLLGGVSGWQFWKTMLALTNALFCSLATGMLVSVASRDSQRALGVTVLVLLALTLGGPILDGMLAALDGRRFAPMFTLASPAYVFLTAQRWLDQTFWPALLTSHLVAWGFLFLASALVPHTWQVRHLKVAATGHWKYAWRFGGRKRRALFRRKLLERNPVMWLVSRERWQTVTAWAITLVFLAGFLTLLAADLPNHIFMVWDYLGWAAIFLFYVGAASQAGKFFVEARRSGMVELLLAAPLTARQIVEGHWRALLRMFGPPVTVLLCVQFAITVITQHSMSVMLTGIGAYAMGTIVAFLFVAVTAANLVALCWFGMWMGMTSRNVNFATLKTLLLVQVIPWFGIYFFSFLLMMLVFLPWGMSRVTGTGSQAIVNDFAAWLPFLNALTAAMLSLAKDAFFIVLARRSMVSRFRELAAQAVSPIPRTTPPPLTRAIPPPVPPPN